MEAAYRHTVRPHYARLLEASGLGLMVVDVRGRVLFVSPKASALLERPADLLCGQSIEALFGITLPKLSDSQELHQRVRYRHKTFALTLVRFSTQIEITFSVLTTPSFTPRVIDFPEDPDDLRALLAESQWRETLYSVLAHHLPNIGVVLFDTDYRYLLAEGEAIERSGFCREMMEGRTMHEALPTELIDDLKPLYDATLNGESLRNEYVYNGRTYTLTTVPIRHQNGTVIAGMVVIHDITSFRAIESELRASQDHLMTLVKAVPDLILVLDREERIIEFHSDEYDEIARALFPQLTIGASLRDSGFPEPFYKAFCMRLRNVYENGRRQIFTLETTTLTNNDYFSVEVNITPLENERVLVVIRDISEFAWMQDLLSRLMERLMALDDIENKLAREVPNMQDTLSMALHSAVTFTGAVGGFIAMLDEDGRWLAPHVTDSVYVPQEVVAYLNQPRTPITEVLASGESLILSREHVVRGAPFLEHTQSQAFIPLNLNDRVRGIVVLEGLLPGTFDRESVAFVELTLSRFTSSYDNAYLRMRAEQQLKELSELYDRVSKLEQLKTDMIRVASHDLRTPMMLIVNYVNLAREGLAKSQTQEVYEYLDAIRAATERMRQMTGEILSLERLQAMANEDQPNIENLAELARAAFHDHQQSAYLKSQTYTLFSTDEVMQAAVDPVQIREAMGNLISNAIKYTPDGGRIDVTLRAENDKIIFSVTDSGYGIPQEAFDKLFQPFYRVPQTRRIAEGTGLGLSLVKSIVERHKGELNVESELGKGSTFSFSLPRYLAPA